MFKRQTGSVPVSVRYDRYPGWCRRCWDRCMILSRCWLGLACILTWPCARRERERERDKREREERERRERERERRKRERREREKRERGWDAQDHFYGNRRKPERRGCDRLGHVINGFCFLLITIGCVVLKTLSRVRVCWRRKD